MEYPTQGSYLGKRVLVQFNFSEPSFKGEIIRDDTSDSYHTVIRLDDGRIVLGVECSFSLDEAGGEAPCNDYKEIASKLSYCLQKIIGNGHMDEEFKNESNAFLDEFFSMELKD